MSRDAGSARRDPPRVRRFSSAEFAVLAITLAWGLSFVVIPRALVDCGPLSLTALRMTVGAGAALVLLRPDWRAADARTWRYGVAGGLLLAAGYLLQTYGMQSASTGDGGFLTAFYVTLVPVFDALVHRKWPARRDVVALTVATAGIALIAIDPAKIDPGPALVAFSAVFWAAQIVAVGRVARGADPSVLAAIQLVVIAAVAGAGLLLAPERPVVWSWDLAASVFFLGYVTCALGFAVQAWAQRKLPPTRTAVLFTPEPVFAALAGWWFRDESFGARKFAGAALILAAVALTLAPSRHRDSQRAVV